MNLGCWISEERKKWKGYDLDGDETTELLKKTSVEWNWKVLVDFFCVLYILLKTAKKKIKVIIQNGGIGNRTCLKES